MEIEERQPVSAGAGREVPAGPRSGEPAGEQSPEPSGPRRSPFVRRPLIAAAAGCAVLGGVLMLLPSADRDGAARPAPGPVARAVTAVGSGVPAALPDLVALVHDHEARVRARPRDDVAWAVLGAAYTEQARRTAAVASYPKAEKALRTSLRLRPGDNTAALEGLASLAGARGDFRAEKQWAEAAAKLAPKRWTAYPALVDAYDGLGDYKAVGRTLDTLLALRTGPAAQAVAARVYRDRGRREDAAAAVSDAAAGAAGPAEQAAYLTQAGDLAWERGDRRAALDHYRAAVATDAYAYEALAGQGRALAALGRTAEALRAYRRALAERPEPRYALELGEVYEKLGRGAEARAQYGLLRELVRRDGAAGVDDQPVLGLFEADHGDPRAAVQALRAEWRRQPGLAVADALGWALHRAGDDKEALEFAVRATDQEHGGGVRSALFAYHRGRIERELGLFGPARRHLAEALRISPYFSPLLAPEARESLTALGDPPAGGPPDESGDAEGAGDPGGAADTAGSDRSGTSGESRTPEDGPGEATGAAGPSAGAAGPSTAGTTGAAGTSAPSGPASPAARPERPAPH
ncbi:tetratricopeptide repeat protein [Streptomyces sp. NPDC127038]|uniref:tetratricopeptide repeat protein n=1 Tax=Streptomyces sp. NPDC127038 TaxID=3347114 RepID=UPI0036643719